MLQKALLSVPVIIVGLYDVLAGVVIVVIDLPMTLGSKLLGIASALLGLILLACLALAWRRPGRFVVLLATWSSAAFVAFAILHFIRLGIMSVTVALAAGAGLGVVYALLCLSLSALVRRNLSMAPQNRLAK
jgi:hypothetical protein